MGREYGVFRVIDLYPENDDPQEDVCIFFDSIAQLKDDHYQGEDYTLVYVNCGGSTDVHRIGGSVSSFVDKYLTNSKT